MNAPVELSAVSAAHPFPGLRPFTQDEDYLFFGREEQTLELLQRLGSQRFVAVVGSSGSGKSSLVRCGLLSELLGGRMLEAGAAWEIAVTHPGGNPLALLTDALLDADLYDREAEHARENLLATPHPKIKIAKARPENRDWLAQIDLQIDDVQTPSEQDVKARLKDWVPEYSPGQ